MLYLSRALQKCVKLSKQESVKVFKLEQFRIYRPSKTNNLGSAESDKLGPISFFLVTRCQLANPKETNGSTEHLTWVLLFKMVQPSTSPSTCQVPIQPKKYVHYKCTIKQRPKLPESEEGTLWIWTGQYVFGYIIFHFINVPLLKIMRNCVYVHIFLVDKIIQQQVHFQELSSRVNE